MALLKETKKRSSSLIPVIGLEGSPESFTEPTHDIYSQTAERSYYKAEARGFEPGHEMEDWLESENELSQ